MAGKAEAQRRKIHLKTALGIDVRSTLLATADESSNSSAQPSIGTFEASAGPDAWGQTRIGVLTPHTDIVPEAEFNALATAGISIHVARIPFGGYRPGGMMDPTELQS